jgi:threonyl-tRNA synthetase
MRKNINYRINPGDGAFYGPKIDFHLLDCLGRSWQCATLQLDFQMPERFELEYVGTDGEKHRPVMIHRTMLGSIERFIAIITEHYAGAFPLWLAPVQVVVMPITERTHDYAGAVADKLFDAGFRVETDFRNEKIGFKIREAQMQKIPYMLVLGDKEADSELVTVRERKEGDIGAMTLGEFTAKLTKDLQEKRQNV